MSRTEDPMQEGTPARKRPIRCAIYTRKSTSEGLDREFNTLQAQREAAEAYVASQRGEGWVALPERYDDGGYTGANADRPALQRLLADISNGRINCVVVYKVDRLSRSLLDFARLIEFFERHKVALVSVTQAFNTATSMGRLTLNILLSFAQFEREIISERTRDKMGAARRKGKWMGGIPMLGYRVAPDGGRLVVDKEEARVVREIFALYLKHRSILRVVEELARRGRTTRVRTCKDGRTTGGRPFTVSHVRGILTNVTCIGKVGYKGKVYPGEHEAVIPEATFQAAGEVLARNRRARSSVGRGRSGALLGGLLRCRACQAAMSPVHTRAGHRKYRYYVCLNAQKRGRHACPTRSVSAPAIEKAVVDALRGLAADPERLRKLAETDATEVKGYDPILQQALSALGPNWDLVFPAEQARILRTLLDGVDYGGRAGTLGLTLSGKGLALMAAEMAEDGPGKPPPNTSALPETIHVEMTADLNTRRNGRSSQTEPPPQPPRAAALLALAHQIEGLVQEGRAKDYAAVARRLGLSRARIAQLTRLCWLAPAIQESILTGADGARASLTEHQLRRISAEPDWDRQVTLWRSLNTRRRVRPGRRTTGAAVPPAPQRIGQPEKGP